MKREASLPVVAGCAVVRRQCLALIFTLWVTVVWAITPRTDTSQRVESTQASEIHIKGAIGPATASYIERAIQVAATRHDVCLIITLDTPGGLVASTKEIVQSFYASPVPVVVYVSPTWATAASAGCFITEAAAVAAMAPNSSIGAAHPVVSGSSESTNDPVMKQKLENYGSALIESIATRRHRNVEWAKSSVVESKAITAEKALELKVIDLIATDDGDLLRQLEGRQVDGKTLHTAGAHVVEIPMLFQERVMQHLWTSEVIYLLMIITIYGIIGELSNPGAILPGVAGGIALIFTLYLASVIPINGAGAALIILSVILFVIDLFAPTHGVLTFGGIVSFFLGSLMLFTSGDPAYRLPLTWIIGATVLTTLFFVFAVGAGLRAQRLPAKAGREELLGKITIALSEINAQSGKVFLDGALWNVTSESPIPEGASVVINGIEGLTLKAKLIPSTTTS